jgi:hypothetical protein
MTLSLNDGRTTKAADVLAESESRRAGPASSSCHPVFTSNGGVGTTDAEAEDAESILDVPLSPRHPAVSRIKTQDTKKGARCGIMRVICSAPR